MVLNLLNFNTSHVTVYPKSAISKSRIWIYFNTSHVTVYPFILFAIGALIGYFNTSHVTVYLIIVHLINPPFDISIHLMLRFISNTFNISGATTPISIHLMLRFIEILPIA